MIAIGLPLVLVAVALAVAIGLGAARRPDPHAGEPGGTGSDPGGVPAGGSRSLALLLAAAALVVVVVVLVVTVGVERPPQLDPLTSAPAGPDAGVAWLDPAGGSGSACLWTGRPDGVVTELTCDLDGSEVVRWGDEGIVLRSWAGPQPQLLTVDPDTGDVLDRRVDDAEDPWVDADGAVHSHREGDELVVRTADDGELWRVDAPAGYHLGTATRSPDGRWIVAVDAASRLLVLAADGSSEPRVWAHDVATWSPVVWQDGAATGVAR